MKAKQIRIEGATAYIKINRGLEVIIDSDRLSDLEQQTWVASFRKGKLMDVRSTAKGSIKRVRLSHVILPGHKLVDHRDRNPLNNREKNLRPATHKQNSQNKIGTSRYGYKGVWMHHSSGRFRAKIKIDDQSIHLGYFDTREEAAMAYDAKAREAWGEFACLNFPESSRLKASLMF